MNDPSSLLDTLSTLDDARQWHNRAEEMRVVADGMIDERNRGVANRLADSYERLAKHAEERAQSRQTRSSP